MEMTTIPATNQSRVTVDTSEVSLAKLYKSVGEYLCSKNYVLADSERYALDDRLERESYIESHHGVLNILENSPPWSTITTTERRGLLRKPVEVHKEVRELRPLMASIAIPDNPQGKWRIDVYGEKYSPEMQEVAKELAKMHENITIEVKVHPEERREVERHSYTAGYD